MDKEESIIKIQCIVCGLDTNHKKLWSNDFNYHDEESEFWATDTQEVYSCLGCDHITFRTVSVNSEDIDIVGENEKGEPIYEIAKTITLYPKRDRRMIQKKHDIWNAPTKVRRIYQETIEAYNNGLLTLCGIGIRAIIEAICLEEIILVEGLNNKIDELIKKGIVTPKLGDGLQESRLLGNESAHELETFGDRELLACIQLIENVIDGHYSTADKILSLKSRKVNK